MAMPRSWFYYSKEPVSTTGVRGPWGPIDAADQATAERIAAARLEHQGLSLLKVEENRPSTARAAPREDT